MINKCTWIIWLTFLSLIGAECYLLFNPISSLVSKAVLMTIPFTIFLCAFLTFMSINDGNKVREIRPILPTVVRMDIQQIKEGNENMNEKKYFDYGSNNMMIFPIAGGLE